jgi:hypothetical protein
MKTIIWCCLLPFLFVRCSNPYSPQYGECTITAKIGELTIPWFYPQNNKKFLKIQGVTQAQCDCDTIGWDTPVTVSWVGTN